MWELRIRKSGETIGKFTNLTSAINMKKLKVKEKLYKSHELYTYKKLDLKRND